MSPATISTMSVVTIGMKTVAKRDARGRFLKKELSPTPIIDADIPLSTERREEISLETEPSIPEAVQKKRKKMPTKSPYFANPITPSKPKKPKTLPKFSEFFEPTNGPIPSQSAPKLRSPAGVISCIPFPPLTSSTFGLIQEKLAHDPFRLLIAVTFLNRTHGKHAIPVYFKLMQKYPTPESLASASKEDIVAVIQHLGLQNQRAATYQSYAKIFLEDPPVKGKRYPVRNYPLPSELDDDDDGSGDCSPVKRNQDYIRKDEVLSDADPRPGAWEIGHLTQGPYALDSWRIFCRDVLRGVATGWNGEGSEVTSPPLLSSTSLRSSSTSPSPSLSSKSQRVEMGTNGGSFQPEWMRVQPRDKELRAFLRWMWLKEGFEWDPETGEKDVAPAELVRAAGEGRIGWDERGGLRVFDQVLDVGVMGERVVVSGRGLFGQVGNLGV